MWSLSLVEVDFNPAECSDLCGCVNDSLCLQEVGSLGLPTVERSDWGRVFCSQGKNLRNKHIDLNLLHSNMCKEMLQSKDACKIIYFKYLYLLIYKM